jgi:BirA family biotin operon repressor/biotin-[acetyl-CoA-carboxylase] ligase
LSSFDEKRFSAHLKTRVLGRPLHYFAETDSTNTQLLRFSSEGASEGTLALADLQSAGRGRWGRDWKSGAAKNLLFSFLLRPRIGIRSQLSAVLGLASQQAIGMGKLKWPNDIWIGSKKIAGMLIEENSGNLIVGLGLNVNQTLNDFPDDLRDKASSLKIETGRDWDREELLAKILSSCEEAYERWQVQGFDAFKRQWNENALFIGENVNAGKLQGIALGLDDDGGFLVQTSRGIEKLISGEVFSLRPVLD